MLPKVDEEIKLLEIGVGGYDDPHKGGESLKMWLEFFSKGKIFALDFFYKNSIFCWWSMIFIIW